MLINFTRYYSILDKHIKRIRDVGYNELELSLKYT